MAGKKKKKDKKAKTGPLAHIAASLVPNAIFAAVPLTSSAHSLSSTWPRAGDRSQSPIAKALRDAGSLGTIIGDVHPPSNIPEDGDGMASPSSRPAVSLPEGDYEEPGYESVETDGRFERKNRLFGARSNSDATGSHDKPRDVEGQAQTDHFYHVLDHENKSIVEPTYAKVDKKKKKSVVSPEVEVGADADDSALSSSDDLTDVTSNDDESFISVGVKKSISGSKKSKRGSKKSKQREEDTSGENKKKDTLFHFTDSLKNKSKSNDESSENPTDNTSKRRKSQKRYAQDSILEQIEGSAEKISDSPPPSHDAEYAKHRRGSKKASLKRRAQVAPEESSHDEGETLHDLITKPDHPSDDGFDEKQKKALKEVERLGIEGISQKYGLSDISEGEEGYLTGQAPLGTKDVLARTEFNKRRAQFEKISLNQSASLSHSNPQYSEDEPYPSGWGTKSPDEPSGQGTKSPDEPSGRGNKSPDMPSGRGTKSSDEPSGWGTTSPDEYRRSWESLELLRHSQTESLERLEKIRQANENSFQEQERHLERLISQQEAVYRQQSEQQKEQQRLREELAAQQNKIQEQLKILENFQLTRENEGVASDNSYQGGGDEVRLQREMLEQQQKIIKMQQQQHQQHEEQQQRLLKQQEGLCEQIRQLENHQREVQSNLSMLSPRDHELAEIRQHEAQIVSLLDEQKMHQRQYEQMHQRQQQRLDDQARIFHRDRLALEEQQQALLQKLQAQEERSRQIEKELERGSTNKRSRGRKTRRPVNSSESQNLSDGIEGEDIAESVTDEVDAVPMRVRTKAAKEVHKASAKSLQDSEAYKLTQGRLQLLESEKSALGELNSSLQQENKALKQLATSLQKGPGGPSLILQQQVKDLQQENKHLRQTVHRLNVELSRYQAKYRPVLFEEVEGMALPRSGEPAPWLVNTRLLAPLFLAYDDRLKEKEEIIKTYDEELTSFKGRVNEVVKENQELHMRLSKSKPEALELDQWQQLQEQARLVVEENALLMEQQDIQEHKLKEMQRLHGQEVSKLSKRISKLESEKRRMQTEMDDLTRNHSNLMHQYEAVAAENGKKISMEDHVIALDEWRSLLEDLKVKKTSEEDELKSHQEAIQKEKNNLAVELADFKARVTQLERELEAYKKSQKKSERKALFLERKLEHIQDREITAQETLAQVLRVAEKTAEERDSYEKFAKSQTYEQKKVASIIRQGDINIMGLQERLKESKKKSNRKMANVTERLEEKDKEINSIKEHYERELNNLRALLREKNKQIEVMQGERRQVEEELDLVWQKADYDNKHMMESIRPSPRT